MKILMFVLALLLIDIGSNTAANIQVVYTKKQLQAAIYKTAKKNGLNPTLALAVVDVESTWVPTKVRAEKKGNTYSVGLFQMYYPTAKDMGFKGSVEGLKNPDTNIRLGIAHLAKCQKKHGNDVRRIACCHNAGFYIRDSVCKNDEWVVHYQNKIEKSYKQYRNFKASI